MEKGDVNASAGCLRYYGGWADKIYGQTIDTDTNSLSDYMQYSCRRVSNSIGYLDFGVQVISTPITDSSGESFHPPHPLQRWSGLRLPLHYVAVGKRVG